MKSDNKDNNMDKEEAKMLHDFMKKQEEVIKKHGMSIIITECDLGNGHSTYLSYTVGLSDINLPEIFVFGIDPDNASYILNSAANLAKSYELKTDVPVTEVCNLAVMFKAVEPSSAEEYIRMANNRARQSLPAIQLVWPDADGVFPWETGYDESLRNAQPLAFDINSGGEPAPARRKLN